MKTAILNHFCLPKTEWQAVTQHLQTAESEIKKATEFVQEIEKGNLEYKFSDSESHTSSPLSTSLSSMRDKLKQISEEESERNWVTEGLAKFVEILRNNNTNIEAFSFEVIRNLVKYLQANQGGIFILNDDNDQDKYLELTGCYAFDRKKYIEKKIRIGEGLVGQTFFEKETTYMTKIPSNYINITS